MSERAAGKAMIELIGVGKEYGRSTVLADVNLQVAEGESIAIVGESGAGKTTVARILLRLATPSTGQYLFDGRDVAQLTGKELRRWRRQVQAVFQNPSASLNPRMRVDRLITEPIEVENRLTRDERTRRAGQLAEMVGLPSSSVSAFPHQLSGGQRQRVAIARAIGTRPRVIVLDEPVSSLDVSVKAQILNTLKDLRASLSNVAYVYVTHDLATVPYLCDRVYVMYRGLIFEHLSTDQLETGASNPYTQMLLGSVLSLSEMSTFSPTYVATRKLTGQSGCPFSPRCPVVVEKCFEELPGLTQLGTDRVSRCHRSAEASSERFPSSNNPELGDAVDGVEAM